MRWAEGPEHEHRRCAVPSKSVHGLYDIVKKNHHKANHPYDRVQEDIRLPNASISGIREDQRSSSRDGSGRKHHRTSSNSRSEVARGATSSPHEQPTNNLSHTQTPIPAPIEPARQPSELVALANVLTGTQYSNSPDPAPHSILHKDICGLKPGVTRAHRPPVRVSSMR